MVGCGLGKSGGNGTFITLILEADPLADTCRESVPNSNIQLEYRIKTQFFPKNGSFRVEKFKLQLTFKSSGEIMSSKVDLPISDANVVLILEADPLAETCRESVPNSNTQLEYSIKTLFFPKKWVLQGRKIKLLIIFLKSWENFKYKTPPTLHPSPWEHGILLGNPQKQSYHTIQNRTFSLKRVI